jgi:hypothetical protein
MVEFQTLKADEVKFGKNNFLEVARKKAIAEEGENEFIAISRGFFLPDGTKRFKKSLAIPDDKEIAAFLADKIKEFCSGSSAGKPAKKAPAEEPAEETAEEPAEETADEPAEETEDAE